MAVCTSGGLLNEKPLAQLTIPAVPMRCMDLARTPCRFRAWRYHKPIGLAATTG